MKMYTKGLPDRTRLETENEIKLAGTTICPGIGIGRVRVLGRELVVPRRDIQEDQIRAEKERYSQAVQLVSDHLLEHIKGDHSDSSLSASLILKSHQTMLMDEQFHDAVRSRIVAESKNAVWALELQMNHASAPFVLYV